MWPHYFCYDMDISIDFDINAAILAPSSLGGAFLQRRSWNGARCGVPWATARNRGRGRFREDAPWLECGPGAKKATGGAPRGGPPFRERVRSAPRKRPRAGHHGTGSGPSRLSALLPPPPWGVDG